MVSIKFQTLVDYQKEGASDHLPSAIHSGNGGDIIYSLPTVKTLGIRHIILNVYRSPDPLRKLAEEMARSLAPLLLAQDYLDRVTIVSAGVPLERVDPGCIDVDYVLDRFRLEDISSLHLIQAHARAMQVDVDPNEPFLSVPENNGENSPELALSLTPRYRVLTEEFVRELTLYFEDMIILAVPEEWRAVSGIPGRIRKCQDFLQMAQLIQRARLFIGNPSLPSAIAEGLKVQRLVDLPLDLPNAFPIGPHGYVLPASREQFLNLAQRLRGKSPRLSLLYGDLKSSLEKLAVENRELKRSVESAANSLRQCNGRPEEREGNCIWLVEEAGNGKVTLTGGLSPRVDSAAGGIYLHPQAAGAPAAQAKFTGLELTGQNCFETDLAIDHEHSEPVRFYFRICDESGSLLVESWRELSAATTVRWNVLFPRTVCRASLELSTMMSPSATSEQHAWAWFKRPRLVSL